MFISNNKFTYIIKNNNKYFKLIFILKNQNDIALSNFHFFFH